MGSVGVIVSSLLVQSFGWYIVDPICSIFIALLIIASVVPLLRESAEILILATPNYNHLQATLDKVYFILCVIFSFCHTLILSYAGLRTIH